MKIFISWSGKVSHEFALVFDDWIQCVIPNIQTFLSSRSIGPGTRWGNKVAQELEGCNAGIICLTNENIMSPWINFEAGALSKYIESSKVIPILINVSNEEISKSPLAQFQTLSNNKSDMEKLMISLFEIMDINNSKASKIFNKWWDDFEVKVNKIKLPQKNTSEKDKYEILLQDFNKLNEGVKTQIHQFKDILADLTRPQPSISSNGDSVFSKLTGLWKNSETDSMYFGLIIDGKLYLPYLYNNEEDFLAHYHSIKVIGNRIYGRFLWFNRDISGYFYLDIINDHLLEGAWFYSHEVSLDKVEDINFYESVGTTMIWEKVIPSKEPYWVKTYIQEELFHITS